MHPTSEQREYRNHILDLFSVGGRGHEQFEKGLLRSGVALPFPHRCAWALAQKDSEAFFVAVRTRSGSCVCGFAVDVETSRVLPGHRTWRVERFAPALTRTAREIGLQALVDHARRQKRVLRVHVEVFSRDPSIRHVIEQVATSLGFRRRENSRMYTDTIAIDLTLDEDKIFGSLHPTARRHIRRVGRHPVALRPVTDIAHAERLAELVEETITRTGGRTEKRDWPAVIDFSKEFPELSRIIGLFRTDVTGPSALLSFAWSRHHGDHADYAVAASTRTTDINLPLGYAAAWDLICWAKRNGAKWFDFGGITSGTFGGNDPIGGISDFKRYFSKQIVTVADEWVFEPHPLRAKLANTVSAAIMWTRNVILSS